MSDLFSIYEDSFNILTHGVNKLIESLGNLSKEKTEQALNDANSQLLEAENHLKKMELECEANFGKNSDRLKLKVNNYKNEFRNLKSRFTAQQALYIDKKSEEALQEAIEKGNPNFINQDDAYYKQTERLEDGKRKIMSVDQSAIEVGKELSIQTDKMKNMDSRLVGLTNSVEESDTIVTRMMKRENKTKLLIFGLIVALAVIFVLICFYQLSKDSDKLPDSENLVNSIVLGNSTETEKIIVSSNMSSSIGNPYLNSSSVVALSSGQSDSYSSETSNIISPTEEISSSKEKLNTTDTAETTQSSSSNQEVMIDMTDSNQGN